MAWAVVAALAITLGVRYILTEPLIFEPGGWFALDGRRVLEAGAAWRNGEDPYAIPGFLYSPVAVTLAGLLAALPPAAVILAWIAASAVVGAAAVWFELGDERTWGRIVAVSAALLFIPTIADLVLANVTIVLVVAVWVAIRGGRLHSGMALGILMAAFPKPFLVPLILWLLVWRPRAGVGAIGAAAVAAGAAFVVAGAELWVGFVESLLDRAGADMLFVGNYGVSAVAPGLAVWAALGAAAVFVLLLALRRRGPSLLAATAVGVFIAPYAGIYAAVPLMLGLRPLAMAAPWVAIVACLVAIVTAPWSPIAAGFCIAASIVMAGAPRVAAPSASGTSAAAIRSGARPDS